MGAGLSINPARGLFKLYIYYILFLYKNIFIIFLPNKFFYVVYSAPVYTSLQFNINRPGVIRGLGPQGFFRSLINIFKGYEGIYNIIFSSSLSFIFSVLISFIFIILSFIFIL